MKLSPALVVVIKKSRSFRPNLTTAVALALLLGTIRPATAAPLFAAPFLSFETGTNPVMLALGDLNGDGKPDLAVANQRDGTISVLLGNGDGTFGLKSDYRTGGGSNSVAIADLNGDGKLDLAATTYYESTVSVLLGNGDGTFGPHNNYQVGPVPTSVAIGDVNGDGRPDLATANSDPYSGNTVSVLLGNGDGTFGPKRDFETAQGPKSVAIGDLNGDGKLDLAISIYGYAGTGTKVAVMLGNGDGTFGSETDYEAAYAPVCVAIGDLNADGRLDLAVAGSSVSVLFGNGDGTFQPKRDYGAVGPNWVAIGDLNADGQLDLALAVSTYGCPTCGKASVLFGNGDGTFGPISDFGAGADPWSVAIGDLNVDGKPDLAVANGMSNSVAVFLGNGDGTFGTKVAHETGPFPASVAMGDLNGDGKPDLAVANLLGYSVSIFRGNGDGTFAPRSDFGTGDGTPGSLAIGDLNGDGKPDLAVLNDNSATVSVLLGNGDGTFGPFTDLEARFIFRFVRMGDLNGDGKLDLVAASAFTKSSVLVLLGNGDGTFGAGSTYGTAYNPVDLAIGDLNEDGRPDLAVASDHYEGVSVLLGNGDGTFQPNTDYTTGGPSTHSVAIGDLNGDGKLDLVAGESGTFGVSSVCVRLGNGDGTFGPNHNFATNYEPVSAAIRDLNGDGKLDVAMVNGGANTISVLLGNGDGSLQAKTEYGTGSDPRSLAVGDLNGDSKPDLTVADFRSNTVSVLLNIGAPSCVPTPMSFDLSPNTLNLQSKGRWITATLEPDAPATPADIDIASILLNGSVPVDPSAPTSIGDADQDGRPDLTVKLSRAAVELAVEEGNAVTVTITGKIGSGCFEATDVIRVQRGHVSSPTAGSVLQGGSTTEVRWDTSSDESVRLLFSADDGATWNQVAQGLPNSGTYLWTVPSTGTDRAKIAVMLGGPDEEVLGVSDRFTITSVTGVGDESVSFALRGAVPNPGRGLHVSFSLANAEPAMLAVYDVNGRRVMTRQVGSLGPGRHVVSLGAPGTLAPGIYLVRLVRGSRGFVTRAVVLP